MTGRLFGTDGVRGAAGELLTAELALALGRAAVHQAGVVAPARADHPRHARIGAHAAGGVRGGRCLGRRRGAARRRAADPGGAAAGGPRRPRAGRGAVGLAQPLPRQRGEAVRRRRLQDLRRGRVRRSRPSCGKGRLAPAPGDGPPHFGHVRRLRGTDEHYLAALPNASTTYAWTVSTSCWTVRTARPSRWRPRSSGAWELA